jgi:hypothetical protein
VREAAGRNGGADHFEDAFLSDFGAAGDGHLPEAVFPPIDAGASFGQPVDLEDIQVWVLGPCFDFVLFFTQKFGINIDGFAIECFNSYSK